MKTYKCQAEDQAGWPCCDNKAKWYVPADKALTGIDEYYCDLHHENNRFYRPDQMLPLKAIRRVFAKLIGKRK